MWGQFVIYCDTVYAQLVKYKVPEALVIKYYETLKTVNPAKAAAVLQCITPANAAGLAEQQRQATENLYTPTAAKRYPLGLNSSERPSKPKNYQTLTEAMQINRRQQMIPTKSEGRKVAERMIPIEHLKQIWKPPLNSPIREDWLLWMDTLRLECLKNSPVNSLNCCSQLAESHPPLAK